MKSKPAARKRTPSRVWVFFPKRQTMPPEYKNKINQRTEKLVARLKNDYVKRKPPKRWNYAADVYGKWRGNTFYLCAKYNCPGPNALSPSFESKFARLEYFGNNSFRLYAMRHNGEWLVIEGGAPLERCFQALETNTWFRP